MVRIVHIMPGRLRLRMDAVRRRPDVAKRLQEQLMTVSGVRGVAITTRTGSVLLSYDRSALVSAEFLDDLSAALGTLFPAHFAPGRARVRVDLLKGRSQLAQRIQQQLTPLAGIHQLEIDPSDGACLIVYDSRAVTSPEFIDAMWRPLDSLLPGLDVKRLISRIGLDPGGRG